MKGYVVALLTMLFVLSQAAACKEIRTIELNGRNTIAFAGVIDALSNDMLTAAIIGKRALLPPDQTLYLVIASGGGNYRDALILKNFIAVVPNMQVICKYCASAAGMVFATFKNHRMVIESSEMMMHEMYVIKVTANMLLNKSIEGLIESSDEFNSLIRNVMGMSKKDYESKIIDQEWSVFGKELLKLKLADEIVKINCSDYVKAIAPHTCAE